jgi:hypothetical protein
MTTRTGADNAFSYAQMYITPSGPRVQIYEHASRVVEIDNEEVNAAPDDTEGVENDHRLLKYASITALFFFTLNAAHILYRRLSLP